MPLEITQEDSRLLQDVLENYLSDLRMEIADTDSLDYRLMLKERRDRIGRILEILRAPGMATAAKNH